MGLRLTKDLVGKILSQNEGFTKANSYKGRNISVSNQYTISDGKLYCRSTGKTSWADSHFDESEECDIDQTRRFIHKYEADLTI